MSDNDNYTSTAIGPIELFHSAGVLRNTLKGEAPNPHCRISVASLDREPVTSPYAVRLLPQVSLRSVNQCARHAALFPGRAKRLRSRSPRCCIAIGRCGRGRLCVTCKSLRVDDIGPESLNELTNLPVPGPPHRPPGPCGSVRETDQREGSPVARIRGALLGRQHGRPERRHLCAARHHFLVISRHEPRGRRNRNGP